MRFLAIGRPIDANCLAWRDPRVGRDAFKVNQGFCFLLAQPHRSSVRHQPRYRERALFGSAGDGKAGACATILATANYERHYRCEQGQTAVHETALSATTQKGDLPEHRQSLRSMR